ncbi:MAG: hypothetical protein Q4D34_07090, partial [Eggerthellaceae bacterium]|nr:hypothetical protein [Eggerthellaceae bacterium]
MRLSVDKVANRMRKMREDHACEKAGVPVWGADGFIAHAGGGYEGEAYTNSREALTRSLQAGALAIEMDFMFTTDDVLV